MKIVKFIEFIKEELNDMPEQYVSTALSAIKKSVESVFGESEDAAEETEKREKSANFRDFGVRLESSEISKYSKLNDSYTVKFSDDYATYSLIFIIELSEAIPKDKTKNFSFKDIKKCYVKFKKYDLDTFEIIGQLDKNIGIVWPEKSKKEKSKLFFEFKEDDVAESEPMKLDVYDFLIYLKNEFDDDFEGGEEFEIETE